MMSSKQAIEMRLLERRATLLGRYRGELERADEELGTRDSETIERASEEWDARVLSQLGEVDAGAIARVVAALRRLEDGTYGQCVTCGERVSRARLEAVPETATCITCARASTEPRAEMAR